MGTNKGETIRGTARADVIVARGGADKVYGRGGKDLICGGGGSDNLDGGIGADVLKGGAAMDTCAGGPGPDRLFSCNEPATTGTLTITTNTVLTAPHKGNIVISADGVRLDCDGHVITGPGSGTGIKVFGRRDVVIVGCHATNFDEGFFVTDTTAIVLRSSSANHNGEGIRIQDSVAILTANVANRNESWGFILVNDTAGTVLKDNVADDNALIDFALSDSDGNRFESNYARGHGTNFDISGSNGNTFISNTANGAGIGFHLGDSDDNIFRRNVAIGRSGNSGFALNGSSGNTFKKNTAPVSAQGFHSYLGSLDNTFDSNTARNNDVGFIDQSTAGSGSRGTDNTYVNNACVGNVTKSDPRGLC